MTDNEIAAYVDAAARAAGIEITPERRAGTLENFARIAAMHSLASGVDVGDLVDPAPVFRHD
jgi:Protein of unknown function (DUF4089)